MKFNIQLHEKMLSYILLILNQRRQNVKENITNFRNLRKKVMAYQKQIEVVKEQKQEDLDRNGF